MKVRDMQAERDKDRRLCARMCSWREREEGGKKSEASKGVKKELKKFK